MNQGVLVGCLGFLAGVAGFYGGHRLLVLGAVVGSVIYLVSRGTRLVMRVFVATGLVVACFMGAQLICSKYEARHASQLSDEIFNHKALFTAVVASDPDRGITGQKVVVGLLTADQQILASSIPDRILLRLGLDTDVNYGEHISFETIIEHPEPFLSDTNREFDYPRYLSLHDIVGVARVYQVTKEFSDRVTLPDQVLKFLYSIKKQFVRKIINQYPSPESGFLAGIVIGVKSLMPADVGNDFQIAGLTHMIVLSGYNITIVATVFAGLFAWLGLGYSARRIAAIVAIIIFIIITGLNASAVRAGIMASLAFMLQITCRPAHTLRIIVFALTIMIISNPRALLWDPSLHLSFLAFIGLCYVAPITSGWVAKWPNPLGITKIFGETLGVQLFVLPYILWMSGRVSALSLVSNIVTVPIVPFLMAGGFFSVMGGILFRPLGILIALPVKWGLSYIIWVAHRVASISATTFIIPPFGVGVLIICYAVTTILLTKPFKRQGGIS